MFTVLAMFWLAALYLPDVCGLPFLLKSS